MMETFLFYFFAFMTLLCGFLVVANPFSRSPVTSAMFLVLAMVWLSGLFVLLQAFFLAAVQILVYAGAVMVLFLFVIMLLNLPEEEKLRVRVIALVGGMLAAGAITLIFFKSLYRSPLPGANAAAHLEGSTVDLGKLLFSQYVLPFEIVSLLLLVAMVGVVLLSKKDLK
jgi:NADH-quinone oxidoreductase subunit J